jgi:metallo-beta-lactamase family protein
MSEGGRVMHHEINFLPDPNNTILLMGYQAVGTLGRKIQEGNKKVVIKDKVVEVRAKVEMISGYSSHRDSDGLLDLVSGTKDTVKKVFVVLGEPKSALFLVQKLRDELGVEAVYPKRGVSYTI